MLASLIDHDKPTVGYMYTLRVYEQFLPYIYRVSATAYGRDIIHIYLLYVFHAVTVIILFCKHWGSHSAFNFLNIWTYVL